MRTSDPSGLTAPQRPTIARVLFWLLLGLAFGAAPPVVAGDHPQLIVNSAAPEGRLELERLVSLVHVARLRGSRMRRVVTG